MPSVYGSLGIRLTKKRNAQNIHSSTFDNHSLLFSLRNQIFNKERSEPSEKV